MTVFKINTTQWDEDSFLIMTSLDEKRVRKIIEPIIDFERENDLPSNFENYLSALGSAYPKAVILTENDFETINF